MKKEKVGFFGGTFDPPHFGHLNLLVEIKEKCELDRILVCPAYLSPTKANRPAIASAEHRFRMVELMIEGLDAVEVTDSEISRPPPSFTIDTIDQIADPEKQIFYLIMAADTAYTLGKWKDSETLLKRCSPLIGTRHGFDSQAMQQIPPDTRERLQKGEVPLAAMDISSSRVRERLKKNLFVGHLIPAKVLDYIYKNRLY